MNVRKMLREVRFELGRIVGSGLPFLLNMAMLAVHMVVLGGSGSGKSNFLELLVRYLLMMGKSFTFIDPHGDTATKLMAFVLRLDRAVTGLFKRVHYLEISPERAFALDPAAKLPGRDDVGKIEYDSLLKALVDRIVACILRRVAEANQELMNRLKRWLENVVCACCVDYMGNNTHVGLHKALVFTNPDHPEFRELIAKVMPFLPDEVRADFRELMDTKRPIDRERWVESTINRLRKLLSPLIKVIFSQQKPSIDVYGVIRRGESIIASFPKSRHLSHAQKVTIIGLLIDEVLYAKEAEEREMPEHLRQEHVLIVDEAGEVMGEDLKLAFGAVRKYKMPIVVGAQNLDKLALGDLKAGAEAMAETQMKVVFQLQEDENVQKVTKDIGHGNIDYTERQSERLMQRGWTEHHLEEHSFGEQESSSGSEGGSESRTDTSTIGKAKATVHATNWSDTQAHANGNSDVQTDSNSQAIANAPGGTPRSTTMNNAKSTAHTNNSSDTESKTSGGSASMSETESETKGTALQAGKNWSASNTKGMSHTVAFKTMLLANLVSEMEPNGQLAAGPESAQWGKLMQTIHGLLPGEAVVKLPKRKDAFQVKIHLAKPAWHGTANEGAAEVAKRLVMESKPYFFSPKALEQPPVPHALDIRTEADTPHVVDQDVSRAPDEPENSAQQEKTKLFDE